MPMVTMLTTSDNPYDPFDDFDAWYAYDVSHGYNSCAYLARVVETSSELDDRTQSKDIESAIDEIIEFDVLGAFKKVTKNIKEND